MRPSSFGISGSYRVQTRQPTWPPMMSPLLRFFLIFSFFEFYNFCIWLFTALGFAPLLWTFCVVPFLVVYWLCDHGKLWQAVRELKVRRTRGKVLGFTGAILAVSFKHIPWGLFIGCVLCLLKAFSFEKMMYMSDLYSEVVKSVFWKVAGALVQIEEGNRLSWKGSLAYCSPYSRRRIQVKTNCYYTLKPGPTPDHETPKNFKLEFKIESCEVICKYFDGICNDDATRDSQDPQERVDDEEPIADVSIMEASTATPSLSKSSSGTLSSLVKSMSFSEYETPVKSSDGIDEGPSSLTPAEFTPVSMSGSAMSRSSSVNRDGSPFSPTSTGLIVGLSAYESEAAENVSDEASSSLSAVEDPSSSSDFEDHSTEENYGLNAINLEKLEASLQIGDAPLESYTFYQISPEAVMEVKRVMEVLRDQGNLVFSNFHRNVGSRMLEAHARCYDFEEIFFLIINKGYRLHMVKLLGTYSCQISGSNEVVDAVGVALTIFILYYQLSTAPKPIFYVLLVMYIMWQLFQIALHQGGHRQLSLEYELDILVKRGLYYLMKALLNPVKIRSLYGWFHEHMPSLTFCNESYSYPYSSQGQKEVCLLVDQCSVLPIVGSLDYDLVYKKDLPSPLVTQYYDLKNLKMEMTLRRGDPSRENEWKVEIRMLRSYNVKMHSHWYRKIFITEGVRVGNLIAIMEWLVKNDCIGVCKEWSERNRMHVYTYLELFQKVLQEGVQPWIVMPASPIDVILEGI